MITTAELEFVKISSVESPYYRQACMLLEKSFVADERREITSHLLASKQYSISAVLYQNKFVGLQSSWEFPNFVLQEHLATLPEVRNQRLGEAILKKCRQVHPSKLLVLESERSLTTIACRRLNYYKRLGYVINPFSYIQPPYSREKAPVPLFLLSFPRGLTEQEYFSFKKQIYSIVYGTTEEAVLSVLQPYRGRKYAFAKKSLADLSVTNKEDNAYLLQVIAAQEFAHDPCTKDMLETLYPTEQAAFEFLPSDLKDVFEGFNQKLYGNEPIRLQAGFYRSVLMKNQEHFVIAGVLYTLQTENIIGFWIGTVYQDDENKRYCVLDFIKKDLNYIGGPAIGATLLHEFFDPLCRKLNITIQKLDAGWMGRAYWAKKGFVFDEEVMLFSNGSLISQEEGARQNLQEFLGRHKIALCELGIKQEDNSIRKIEHIGELLEPEHFVNLVHLSGKKIFCSAHLDDEKFAPLKELDIGMAFSLGKYYQSEDEDKGKIISQVAQLRHPKYTEHFLCDDALVMWSGKRYL